MKGAAIAGISGSMVGLVLAILALVPEKPDSLSLDELRQRTAAAFEMLGAKNALLPEKRHNNLPL